MVKVDLNTNTLAVLIAGLYCVEHEVESIAIPHSVWLSIAEKLEYFIPEWDSCKISFEEWINTCLLIYPKPLLDESDIKYMEENTLYWEVPNGNIILSVSMDIGELNE